MSWKKLIASCWVTVVTIVCMVTNAHGAQGNPAPPAALVDLTMPAIAISPDGKLIALVLGSGGKQQLHVRSVGSRESKAVPGTEGAGTPLFSPDGKWIAFFAGGKLKKVAIDTEEVVTLCDGGTTPRG